MRARDWDEEVVVVVVQVVERKKSKPSRSYTLNEMTQAVRVDDA